MMRSNGMHSGNIGAKLSDANSAEVFETLLIRPGVRIERIISHGNRTPFGEWYDQSWDEWVLLIAGSADLQLEEESEVRQLHPGDYLLLPAGCRHRVARTDPNQETVWLALHIGEPLAGND